MMKIETLEDIDAVVSRINEVQGDAEKAHALEDELYEAVLRYIAEGGRNNIQEMAFAALMTKTVSFERWCA